MSEHVRSGDHIIERLIDSVNSLATNVAVLTERMDNQYHNINNKLAAHFAADERIIADISKRIDGKEAEIESLNLSRAKGEGVIATATAAGVAGGGLVAFFIDHVPKWFK